MGWTKVLNELIVSKELDAIEFRLFCYIASWTHGDCRNSMRFMSDNLSISLDKLRLSLNRLEDLGLIHISRKKRARSQYTIANLYRQKVQTVLPESTDLYRQKGTIKTKIKNKCKEPTLFENEDLNFLIKCIGHFGRERSHDCKESICKTRPDLWEVIESFGGWKKFCDFTWDNFTKEKVTKRIMARYL